MASNLYEVEVFLTSYFPRFVRETEIPIEAPMGMQLEIPVAGSYDQATVSGIRYSFRTSKKTLEIELNNADEIKRHGDELDAMITRFRSDPAWEEVKALRKIQEVR